MAASKNAVARNLVRSQADVPEAAEAQTSYRLLTPSPRSSPPRGSVGTPRSCGECLSASV